MGSEILLHDTRSGELRELRAPSEGPLGIYACGPTVYGRIHVGNARPFVIFSLLRRFLVHEGYEVSLVMNITDVNDKIYDAARASGEPSAQLAARMAEAYRSDTDALGLGRPDHEPLASQTMDAIVAYIQTLIDSGRSATPSTATLLPRAKLRRAVRAASRTAPATWTRAKGHRGRRRRKQDPLRLALWKARRRPNSWRPARGGAAGLAHQGARRWPRSC
jgi:cysteinyl-tRNA synthetase